MFRSKSSERHMPTHATANFYQHWMMEQVPEHPHIL